MFFLKKNISYNIYYNISYIYILIFSIYTFYNMPPQAEGGGSIRNLKRKVVKEIVESGLMKTFTSLS